AGDYASGTNHTLPTGGAARGFSGVTTESFMKTITFQRITSEGISRLAPTIETMAAAEGLEAHRRAAAIRRKEVEK
ncbi:histidinol dehydrogenase, partial [Escherichia coli]|nr:histidinol dehydrogenase [Escherichia coli]